MRINDQWQACFRWKKGDVTLDRVTPVTQRQRPQGGRRAKAADGTNPSASAPDV
jgi:hypothetical protein